MSGPGLGLTGAALEHLLDALGADRVQAAHTYEDIRSRLIKMFRWRRCAFPETLADETLDRVGRRLADGLALQAENPFRFVSGVAYRVYQETVRREMRERRVTSEARPTPPTDRDDETETEARLSCLDHCLDALPPDDRQLVLRFYQGEPAQRIAVRKALAAELGVTRNALRIRAYRLRQRLEACVRGCLEPDDG